MSYTQKKTDVQLGIRPTIEESLRDADRARQYARDCADLLDELFPEDNRKPYPNSEQRQYGKDRGEEPAGPSAGA